MPRSAPPSKHTSTARAAEGKAAGAKKREGKDAREGRWRIHAALEQQASWKVPSGTAYMTLSPDGEYLALLEGMIDPCLHVFRVADGKAVKLPAALAKKGVDSVEWSPAGDRLITLRYEFDEGRATLECWSFPGLALVSRVSVECSSFIVGPDRYTAVSADGKTAYFSAYVGVKWAVWKVDLDKGTAQRWFVPDPAFEQRSQLRADPATLWRAVWVKPLAALSDGTLLLLERFEEQPGLSAWRWRGKEPLATLPMVSGRAIVAHGGRVWAGVGRDFVWALDASWRTPPARPAKDAAARVGAAWREGKKRLLERIEALRPRSRDQGPRETLDWHAARFRKKSPGLPDVDSLPPGALPFVPSVAPSLLSLSPLGRGVVASDGVSVVLLQGDDAIGETVLLEDSEAALPDSPFFTAASCVTSRGDRLCFTVHRPKQKPTLYVYRVDLAALGG